MKKRNIIIISACVAALVIAGITLGIVLGKNSKKKADLYAQGLQHLCDAEYEEASDIFGMRILRHYKDSPKKYSYSTTLVKYEEHSYTYEQLIDSGLEKKDSIANIDFNVKGGEEIDRKTITEKQEGKYITEVPAKTHYDFVSWGLIYACYELDSDSIRYVLEASYRDHPYNITYELDGGSALAYLPKTYFYDHGNVPIPDPSKPGYDFAGYESSIYNVPTKNFEIPNGTFGDINLTATYEPATFTIKFDVSPSTDPAPADFEVVYGSDVSSTFPVATRAKYNFDYWTYNGEIVDLTNWSIPGNVTLKAHYSPTQYNINYELHGGTNPGLPTSYNTEMKVELPFVEKSDALFIGWTDYPSAGTPNPKRVINEGNSGDITLEAHFVSATITDGVLEDISDHSVKNIVIPSYVTGINVNLISQLDDLLTINVDPSNTHFTAKDNLLIKDNHIAFSHSKKYIPDIITLPENIDEIGENAFKGTTITKVNGGAYVHKIDAGAFQGCTSLIECEFDTLSYVGNSAFENTGITKVFLTNNIATLQHIGNRAFANSAISGELSLSSNSIQHIGNEAFADLTTIPTVSIYPNASCSLGSNIFKDTTGITTLRTDSKFLSTLMTTTFVSHALTTINVTQGNTNIGADACKDVTTLTTLNLSGSTITQIGANAFKGDTSLKTVTLPSTTLKIGAGAFEDCEKLDTLNFGDLTDLITISESSFKGCAFTTLDFTNNPHLKIEDHAFTESTKVKTIKMLHGQITTPMSDVFDLCGHIENVYYYIPATTSLITIPKFLFEDLNNVSNISFIHLGTSDIEISFGEGAFRNCESLVDVAMTKCHVTSVSSHCFDHCSSFTNANENFNDLTRYEGRAFYGCANLSHMSLRGTICIGTEAFAGCYSLCPVTIDKYVVDNHEIELGTGIFYDVTCAVSFENSEAEVADLTADGTKPWWGFDQGFSGTFSYATT